MDELSREDFERMKQNASQRVMQMHKSRTDMPPFPSFVKIPDRADEQNEPSPAMPVAAKSEPLSASDKQPNRRIGSLIKYINLPEMMKNSDAMLLLGLILLLSSESADEKLILALAYILL